MESNGPPTALRSYTLTCNIGQLPNSLNLNNPSYAWFRNNSQVMSSLSLTLSQNQIQFTSLSPSENYSLYQCQYMATSEYVNNNMYVRRSAALKLMITSKLKHLFNKCMWYKQVAVHKMK